MLVGGLGVAYSGNIGSEAAVFEPVHGSAPKLAGLHKANPIATLLSAVLMLEYLDEFEQANRLRQAVMETIRLGQVTEDLGGNLSTEQVTESIINKL
jgi:isocitrate/isopropylmalate dehydrogenase